MKARHDTIYHELPHLILTSVDSKSPHYDAICGRPLPSTSGDSEDDYRFIDRWLNDCLTSHQLCARAHDHTKLPTRVIVVEASHQPYLLESEGLSGLYAALSHCWGGGVPLTTTVSTLDERRRGIPLPSLPKTFQDAVAICRKLGIGYLWIDSLCIVQDSKEDWERESASMCDIYGQSYVTIAARGALNADGGCFIAREKEPPPVTLGYEVPRLKTTGVMFVRDPSVSVERMVASVFDSRAWILQERLLSQRVLYYGSQQVYWECMEANCRQDGKVTTGYENKYLGEVNDKSHLNPFSPVNIMRQDRHLPPRRLEDLSRAEIKLLEHKELMGRWYLCVSEYTRRDLSFETDRLPAIAGIAKEFQRRTSYTYIAGLWQQDLLPGLLWFRGVTNNGSTLVDLPTWLWARFSGRISFILATSFSIGQFEDFEPACEVLNHSFTSLGALGSFGMIRDASLEIRGKVLELLYTPPTSRWEDSVTMYDGFIMGKLRLDEDHPRSWPLAFFCLLVSRSDTSPAGLALEMMEGTPNTFKRIGLVNLIWSLSPRNDRDGRKPFALEEPRLVRIV